MWKSYFPPKHSKFSIARGGDDERTDPRPAMYIYRRDSNSCLDRISDKIVIKWMCGRAEIRRQVRDRGTRVNGTETQDQIERGESSAFNEINRNRLYREIISISNFSLCSFKWRENKRRFIRVRDKLSFLCERNFVVYFVMTILKSINRVKKTLKLEKKVTKSFHL